VSKAVDPFDTPDTENQKCHEEKSEPTRGGKILWSGDEPDNDSCGSAQVDGDRTVEPQTLGAAPVCDGERNSDAEQNSAEHAGVERRPQLREAEEDDESVRVGRQ